MKLTPALFSLLIFSAAAQEKNVPPPFEENPPAPKLEPATKLEPAPKLEPATDDDDSATDPFDPDALGDDTPAIVQVQVEYIEMAHEKLTDLLFLKRPTKSDATELRKEVQAMVKAGDAKVLETQIVTSRSGERSRSESILEQIYPTEAEPSSIPDSVSIPDKKEALTQENIKAIAALVTGPTPTSFATRNVGSSLEIEPTVGQGGKMIDLRFSPELVWHDGNTTWQERTDALGNVAKIDTPDFYSIRLTTALTVKNGSYVLASVVTPSAKDRSADLTRKVMIFVKADVLAVR